MEPHTTDVRRPTQGRRYGDGSSPPPPWPFPSPPPPPPRLPEPPKLPKFPPPAPKDRFTHPINRQEDVISTHLLLSFKTGPRHAFALQHNLHFKLWSSPENLDRKNATTCLQELVVLYVSALFIERCIRLVIFPQWTTAPITIRILQFDAFIRWSPSINL
jgi:hypothetical protein